LWLDFGAVEHHVTQSFVKFSDSDRLLTRFRFLPMLPLAAALTVVDFALWPVPFLVVVAGMFDFLAAILADVFAILKM
jgi:hypothetical protein